MKKTLRQTIGEWMIGKSASDNDQLQNWRALAEFLGIDPETDPDSRAEATYYTCLKILREGVGKLPLKLMRETEQGGIEEAKENPLYEVFNLRPNPYTTPTSFWSFVENERNHYGNAYVYISGNGTKKNPTMLWNMPASEVEVWYDDNKILADVPDVYYRWSHNGKMYVLKSYEVMHFRSSETNDGIMGIPMVDRLGELVNGSIGAQKFQNELITSGMTAKAVLQYTGSLDSTGVKNFTANIEKYAKGDMSKAGVKNIIPIPVGASLTPLNIKLTDSQFAELKKYNAVQIASAFGIKPQQIGDMTKQSYASSQAQQEAFYTDTMLYIIKNYEEEIAYKALTDKMISQGYFAEFDTSVMLRSDFKTQVETYKSGIDGGLYTPNEARRALKLPRVDGADELLCNGNLVPVALAGIQWNDGEGNDDAEGGE